MSRDWVRPFSLSLRTSFLKSAVSRPSSAASSGARRAGVRADDRQGVPGPRRAGRGVEPVQPGPQAAPARPRRGPSPAAPRAGRRRPSAARRGGSGPSGPGRQRLDQGLPRGGSGAARLVGGDRPLGDDVHRGHLQHADRRCASGCPPGPADGPSGGTRGRSRRAGSRPARPVGSSWGPVHHETVRGSRKDSTVGTVRGTRYRKPPRTARSGAAGEGAGEVRGTQAGHRRVARQGPHHRGVPR